MKEMNGKDITPDKYQAKMRELIEKHGAEFINYLMWEHSAFPFTTRESVIKSIESKLNG